MRFLLVFIISCRLFIPQAFSAEIQLKASTDRLLIPINETFTYTLEISGEKANSVDNDPKLPDISEFSVYMGGTGTSQNIQIINGKMSVTKSMNFTFMANKIGKFLIQPAELVFKGKIFKSESIQIEITSQTAKPKTSPPKNQNRTLKNNQSDLKDNLFLRTIINKKRVYVNEPVIISYKIYTGVTVTSYGINKLPNTASFWAEEFPLAAQPKTYREIYNGKEYIVAEIKKMALFPTDAGKKTIGPMQIECDVRVQTQRRRSIFDSFFDDPFFGRTVRQSVNSKPINIEVLPLPIKGKPADFSGVVGNFSITARVDKKQVKTNEAVALKVKIAGSGNIKVLPTPKVEIPADFEQYEPKITQTINRTGNIISGQKNYEYVLIPRFPGTQKIKPIEFFYFDLKTKTYKKISTPEIEINVQKGNEDLIAVGTGLSKEEVRLLGKDIRFICVQCNYHWKAPYKADQRRCPECQRQNIHRL